LRGLETGSVLDATSEMAFDRGCRSRRHVGMDGRKPDAAGKSPKNSPSLGRVIDPPATRKLYAPLQQTEPYFGARIERDLKYGAAERNLLDVFMPQNVTSGRPVLMFVHGGAFIGGNKRIPDSPFYDNIMLWAVKNGFIGVNIGYRLAPQFPMACGRRGRRFRH